MRSKEALERGYLGGRAFIDEPQKDYAVVGVSLTKNHRPEILVGCDDDSILRPCVPNDRRIVTPTCFVKDRKDVVALPP